MNNLIKICRRYWLLAVLGLVLLGVAPTAWLTYNAPLPYSAAAQYEYTRTESLDKCLLLYDFNESRLTKSQILARVLVYKYKNASYYRPLTMSIGAVALVMTTLAYLYEGIDIA